MMIEFIEMHTTTSIRESGQFVLFPSYVIEPGDVGIVVESDDTSLTFLMGNAVLCVDKNLEGITYVCH